MRHEAALQKVKDGNEKGQGADDETRRASKVLARLLDTLYENGYNWDNVLAEQQHTDRFITQQTHNRTH